MSRTLRINIIVAAIFLCGCSQLDHRPQGDKIAVSPHNADSFYVRTQVQPCDYAWFKKVEQQLQTGDGQGHGPDLGSMEWRSVIEFKLGIGGDDSIVSVDSDLWCDYIDKQYID
ncbi:hypothetical protein [Shewanella sp. 0m-4]